MFTQTTIADYVIPAIGWCGATLFLLAYALLSRGYLHASSGLYQALNIAGASCLAISNGSHSAFPSATLNLLWIFVGLHTVLTRHRRQ